jgi:hypothetical protein
MRRLLGSVLPALTFLFTVQAGGAQSVRVFSTEHGLPHNRINSIYLDSQAFLWICTDDGLSRFDGHRFVNYTKADELPHKNINSFLETKGGEYWVASDAGISRFDPRPGFRRFVTYAPSDSEDARHVNALLEESDWQPFAWNKCWPIPVQRLGAIKGI